MKFVLRFFYYWGLPLALMSLIFYFSSMHAIAVAPVYWAEFLFKKTIHFLEYAVLWTLLYRAFTNTTAFSRSQAAIWSLMIAILYGISDEFHQSFTPTREPSIRDIFIDSMGAATAYFCIYVYLPKAPQPIQKLLAIFQIK